MPIYIKKVFGWIFLGISICFLSGCSKNKEKVPVQFDTSGKTQLIKVNIQDYGTVSFRIYPDEAPDASEKFIELCKTGFYDGKPFFFNVDDYLLMGGEKDNNIESKADISKNTNMYPYKGALCIPVTSENNADFSRFYVIYMGTEKLSEIEKLIEHKGYTISDYIKFGYKTELTGEELDLFRKYGGAPWLYGHTIVIGQVFEGMDVFDKIMEAYKEDDDAEILIENIEID